MQLMNKLQVPEKNRLPLIIIVGATAVGKTEYSIALAQILDGEIVSADSRLFYRGMDIGTAKPTLAEREGVPHHLIDIAAPDQTISLAEFQQRAQEIIAAIHSRGRLPFLVGGTGQYIRAVVEGWEVPKQPPDLRLRSAIENWAKEIGGERLHSSLSKLDPEAAAAMDWRNIRRTVRALEVIFLTGQKFSSQRRQTLSPYQIKMIGLALPRERLFEKIDHRIEKMFRDGLVDEVKRLLDSGYSPSLPSMSAIGYQQVAAYLTGKLALDDAVTLIKRQTRVFVRRQANWYKLDDPAIEWYPAERAQITEIEASIRKFLATTG